MQESERLFRLVREINFSLHIFQANCKEKNISSAFSLSLVDGYYQIDGIIYEAEEENDG